MDKLTVYDVFIGIFNNFPKGKKEFRYDREDIVDFICQKRNNYSILSNFTRENICSGLDGLTFTLQWYSGTPDIRFFNPDSVSYSFERFNKELLFGKDGLEELAKLSKEFVGRFV